jgi:phosphomannomutase / phosphoglucomutase
MLDRAPGRSMADLKDALSKNLVVADHVDQIRRRRCRGEAFRGEKVGGQKIRDLVTVNGVRVTVEDGSWDMVRASFNKPELVVVESSVHEQRMHDKFEAMNVMLRSHPEVGEYNQKI